MQVVNKKIFIRENENIICPKCRKDITNQREEAYRTYGNWKNENDQTGCFAEEYVVCPYCYTKTTMTTWTEEF